MKYAKPHNLPKWAQQDLFESRISSDRLGFGIRGPCEYVDATLALISELAKNSGGDSLPCLIGQIRNSNHYKVNKGKLDERGRIPGQQKSTKYLIIAFEETAKADIFARRVLEGKIGRALEEDFRAQVRFGSCDEAQDMIYVNILKPRRDPEEDEFDAELRAYREKVLQSTYMVRTVATLRQKRARAQAEEMKVIL